MRRAKRDRFPRLNGIVPAMHRHLAVDPASLSHAVVATVLNDRRDSLAVLCIGWCAGGSPVVEVIADLTAIENLGGHQLRTHVSLLITQEKLV